MSVDSAPASCFPCHYSCPIDLLTLITCCVSGRGQGNVFGLVRPSVNTLTAEPFDIRTFSKWRSWSFISSVMLSWSILPANLGSVCQTVQRGERYQTDTHTDTQDRFYTLDRWRGAIVGMITLWNVLNIFRGCAQKFHEYQLGHHN